MEEYASQHLPPKCVTKPGMSFMQHHLRGPSWLCNHLQYSVKLEQHPAVLWYVVLFSDYWLLNSVWKKKKRGENDFTICTYLNQPNKNSLRGGTCGFK